MQRPVWSGGRGRTNLCKVLEIHEPVPGLVVVTKNLEHLRLLHVKAKRTHGDLELVVVDAAVLVGVEELERLLDLLLLLVGELGPRVSAAFGLLRCG